jgi:NADPH:quinone reductase-like Zn-dependent oxidoreductase
VSNAGANPAHLAPLADLVVSGKLRVAISQTYPLVDAAKAIDDFAAKHTLGKLVITVP